MSGIRTPDHRLRVFVSSSLGELAAERRSVARAISTLRLTAVMFEAGARPHPPAEVYRAYLAQSDVFIGLYWQRYGDLVPGLDISGLEEEFELSRGMPRLLYLKAPAPERDRRLARLVDRLKGEASYRQFSTPEELGRLVVDDLAHLLSERFAATLPMAGSTVASGPVPPRGVTPSAPLTVSTTSLIGRVEAIHDVARLLVPSRRRLVTLTGPSGVGKTTLAAAVADRVREEFDSGIVLVPLSDVEDPRDVVIRIGWAIGVDLAGATSSLATLAGILEDGRWLIVLDNFERLLHAGPDVAELLARTSAVKILVTSTTVLGLRAEHVYHVRPLTVPDACVSDISKLASTPAVTLFVERAQAVRPDFTLTTANGSAVVDICRRLEGLPLAIEIAAARVQLMDPTALARRLTRSLDTLGTGMADLPDRQRTLRATVEWTIGMLENGELSMLEVLAVFAGGWTVEAAAVVADLDEDLTLELTEKLARHSLLQLDATAEGPRPRMLHTVRSFIVDRLAARDDADDVRRRHAGYYRELAERADRQLRGFRPRARAEAIARENENLALAARWHLAHDRGPLPHLLQVLSPFRILAPFLGGGDLLISEARGWASALLPDVDILPPTQQAKVLGAAMISALELGDAAAGSDASERLTPLLDDLDDPYVAAVSYLLMSWISALNHDLDVAQRRLSTAVDKLRQLDEPMWTAVAVLTSGSLALPSGQLDIALRDITQAQRLAARFDTPWLDSVSRVLLGGLAIARGDLEEADAHVSRALDLSLAAGSTHCLCLALAGSAALSLAHGDPDRAGLLVGAADGLRRREALRVWPWTREDDTTTSAIRDMTGAERFDALLEEGRRLNQPDALDLAREPHGHALDTMTQRLSGTAEPD